ncbi:hypothetical protein KY285_019703 [Solanum tuberosum]|nr:hypothetical protein KY284_019714 [Solanum tuberosum]KAH0692606.1 hypothetical protein KY285_019703 [Solanum tuberosum]
MSRCPEPLGESSPSHCRCQWATSVLSPGNSMGLPVIPGSLKSDEGRRRDYYCPPRRELAPACSSPAMSVKSGLGLGSGSYRTSDLPGLLVGWEELQSSWGVHVVDTGLGVSGSPMVCSSGKKWEFLSFLRALLSRYRWS